MVLELTDLDRVKALLTIPDNQTQHDEVIQRIIVDTSAEVETFLNRSALVAERTEKYDVECGQFSVQVSSYPIDDSENDITVWNDLSRAFTSSTIIAASNYYVNKESGIFYFDKIGLLPGYGILKIQYTGGMAESTAGFITAFPDIVTAVTMEVAARYQRKSNLGLIAATLSGGSVTIAQKQEFLPSVELILERHRRY